MTLSRLRRLASIDRAELRFRLTCAAQHAIDRTRTAVAAPGWHRGDLFAALSPAAPSAAREALRTGNWRGAHLALARHFASRTAMFPIQVRALPELATSIRRHFPSAAADAAARAEKIFAGRYDILGFRDVPFGAPPDWHADPVNGARAPRAFWSSVPFLSPECGDHKVIWEVNRHQHWVALGRSRLLTDDRRCYTAFVAQLEDWLAQNPPLVGINWASMLELAFRALSWLWALHLFAADAEEDTEDAQPWTVDLLLALDRQLTHVERNLSRYFSPNTHLTGEALALYVAGHALPELRASAHRVALGREILLAEVDRQVHTDGGHAELSPHYHRYTTDFYLLALLIARAAHDPHANRFEKAVRSMAAYLRTVADDAGMLPLIGDDDGGQLFEVSGHLPSDASSTLGAASIALDDPRLAAGGFKEEVLWLCGPGAGAKLGTAAPRAWPSTALPDSGYYVLRNGDGDHLVLDAGRHGFLNGGHAHADALSLVLKLRGTPLLVDPGAAVYTVDPVLRDRFRSSAMHNTVVLDGRSQAEPLGPFHWRSRVDARADLWRPGTGFDYVEGSHSAYAPVRHARGVLAIDGFGWLIFDHVVGHGSVAAEAFWHLHPEWAAGMAGDVARLTHPSGARTLFASTAPLRLLAPGDPSGLTLFAPAYGRVVQTHVLTSRAAVTLPGAFATFIAAEGALSEDLRLRLVRPSGLGGSRWNAIGIELAFAGGSAKAVSAVSTVETGESAPGTAWGIEGLRTTGRVAAVIRRATGAPIDIAIDGVVIEGGAVRVSSPDTLLQPAT